jgi:outer membrane usher protein
LLLKKDGDLMASAADIQRWRLALPSKQSFSYQGHEYYPLNTLAGISYRIDEATQALFIEVKPKHLLPTQLDGSALSFSMPELSSPGGFINYDIFAQSSALKSIRVDSLMELGLFSGRGVGVSNFLGQDI